MGFAQTEAEFGRLKAQFDRGDLAEAEFKAKLEDLMVKDEQGRWWMIGYETGQWYVHDGEKWMQQGPPRPAPSASPTHPRHPGEADLRPDSPPGRTSAAPSKPALGLRLGIDGMSVLLSTVGWLFCWAIFGLVFEGSFAGGSVFSIGLAIAGLIGGLVTGLVLRRTDLPSPWWQVLVIALGWAFAWGISGILMSFQWMVNGAIGGFVGGTITALVLKWTQPSLQWKHVALVILGWGIGWAVGGAIGLASLQPPDEAYLDLYQLLSGPRAVFGGALWGGIGGGIGTWVMYRQLREAAGGAP